MQAEAAIVRLVSSCVLAGGGTAAGARDAAETLTKQGALALISFGLAGGLDPALPAGAIVIPRRVASARHCWATDPRLSARLGHPNADLIFAGTSAAATIAEKSALHRATGAVAIDLESGAIAAVAARHGLPFAVIRAICDPADRHLPPAALAALDAAGFIAFRRVAESVLRHPGQIGALLRLARDAAAARRSLIAWCAAHARP